MSSTLTAKQLKKLAGAISQLPKNQAPAKKAKRGRSRKQAKRENAAARQLDFSSTLAPAAMSGGWGLTEPRSVPPLRGGLMRFRHREFVTSVSGATSFTSSVSSINPGLVAMFPWLSRMANNFESYLFHDLKFHFRTKKGSSTAGDVMLAVDFDAADGAPASEQDVTSFKGYRTAAVWENFCISYSSPTELQKSKQYYVRQTTVSGTDIKTYDVGNLVIAVDACADTTSIGRILVEYDIELFTPQMQNPLLNPISERVNSGGTVSKSAIFGDAATYEGNALATASGSTLTFAQPGEYSVVLKKVGTGITTVTLGGTATSANIQQVTDAAGTSGLYLYSCVTSAAGQTLVLTSTADSTVTSAIAYLALYESDNWSLQVVGAALDDRIDRLEELLEELMKARGVRGDEDGWDEVKPPPRRRP